MLRFGIAKVNVLVVDSRLPTQKGHGRIYRATAGLANGYHKARVLGYGNSMLIMQGVKVCPAGSSATGTCVALVDVKTGELIDTIPI